MSCAIIRRFAFFQISGFFQYGNLLAQHLEQTNARGPDEFFSRTMPTEPLISTICQILNSFVTILNTRSAIGHSLQPTAVRSTHGYEVRLRKVKLGVNLISDALPFGRLWYDGPNAISNAIGHAKHRSRSHDAVIRVYDAVGNVIETYEHKGDFKEW
jgi:hypothetical protein